MQLSSLYFLSKLYDFTLSLKEKGEGVYRSYYDNILRKTSKDIIFDIPEEIRESAEELFDDFKMDTADELLLKIKPFKEECLSFLPDLDEKRELFHSLLADCFCDKGYRYENGAFRKVEGRRFYYIDADLNADFITDGFGNILRVSVFPTVRIADTKIKKDKDRYIYVANIPKENVSYYDIKNDGKSFYKTLRHLETLDLGLEEKAEISEDDIKRIAESCLVAPSVCENKKIPSYYKKLCKNDFPLGKALSLSFWQGVFAYVIITLICGIGAGATVFITYQLPKVLALFTIWQFYIVTLIPAVIYAFFVFRKTRSGRF